MYVVVEFIIYVSAMLVNFIFNFVSLLKKKYMKLFPVWKV